MMTRTVTFVLAVLFASPLFAADVIISEIMYNPDSIEGRSGGDNPVPCMTEWVELYNRGDAEVDLSGWVLGDEDGSTSAFPDGIKLAAGEALVVIPAECDVAKFKEAWGDDFQIVPVTGWSKGGMFQLANSPDEANEILTIKDAAGNTVDGVNFDDEGAWPSDEPDGPSIYVTPDSLDAVANDNGSSWARSTAGTHEAKQNTVNDVFTGHDIGSPGKVAKE